MTDNSQANTLNDMIRGVFAAFNKGIYFLLGAMYQIFFNVSSAQLFENETIKNFYGRIQLIIGVFMIFKLAVTVLQGIMDPDKFTNPKEGIGNVVTRIVISLAMLTLLVPISIPNATNSFEVYINNNGLLFGTLYSLQDRILSGNTLGRLILGTTDDNVSESQSDDGLTPADKQNEKLAKSARIFSATILKGFLRINLVPEDVREDDDETKNANRYCQDIDDDVMKTYTRLDVDTGALLDLSTASCDIDGNLLQGLGNAVSNATSWIPVIGALTSFLGNTKYVFVFDGFLSLVVGIVFLVILIGFTVDIAIRSIKLSILRLLAPIPIISYIDPKSAKDGAFASWVKALTSTYLDLFLRLAIVYFVIFLIQDMIVNGIIINNASGMVGIMSTIFIWIGLFFFARMAPKFIKEALGLKGNMSNVGLSGILGGSAMLAGGIRNGVRNAREEGTSVFAGALKGGAAGFTMGAMNGTEAAVQGYNQGKPQGLGSAWSQNRALMRQISTGDKDSKGAIADFLNYQNRNMAAGAAGYSKRNMAIADWNKKRLQKEAGEAKGEYEDATNALNAFTELNRGMQQSDPERYNATYSRLYDRVREARANRDRIEISYQKASSAAGTIEKYRSDVYRAAPRAYDTTRTTYRSGIDVVDNPLYDDNGHVIKNKSNFESGASPVDPYKGEDGIPRVDDDWGGPMGPPGPPPM